MASKTKGLDPMRLRMRLDEASTTSVSRCSFFISFRRYSGPCWDTRQDQPAIAIEFVSASTRDFQRDYIDKRDEYLRAGVREYWIIDRFRRRMTVVRGGADPVTESVITEQEMYTTSLLPGFELPLAPLLAVADVLEEAERR